MARLGGLSAPAVYRILTRLVDTLESLVRGDPREALALCEQVAQNRLDSAASLIRLQQRLNAGTSLDQINSELDRALESLMPKGVDAGVKKEASVPGS